MYVLSATFSAVGDWIEQAGVTSVLLPPTEMFSIACWTLDLPCFNISPCIQSLTIVVFFASKERETKSKDGRVEVEKTIKTSLESQSWIVYCQ